MSANTESEITFWLLNVQQTNNGRPRHEARSKCFCFCRVLVFLLYMSYVTSLYLTSKTTRQWKVTANVFSFGRVTLNLTQWPWLWHRRSESVPQIATIFKLTSLSCEQIDICCFSQSSVKNPSEEAGNSVYVLLQIHLGICAPKIIKIGLDVT